MEGQANDRADDPLQQVTALLGAAGLSPPPEEIERLAGLYPGLRKAVDRFHRVDVGDEVTAAVFEAQFDTGFDTEFDTEFGTAGAGS